ncbi:MAG: uroporphyrinogen decarboxylase family protein [Actinomycetota bacterium]
MYEKGSLENTGEGFRFCFVNTMTPVRISGMRDVLLEVDGEGYPIERMRMALGGRPVTLEPGGLGEMVDFGKGTRLTVDVLGDGLTVGRHVMKISFITNEYGGATLKVVDAIPGGKPRSLLDRISGRIGHAEGVGGSPSAGPLTAEGELGGVPLDPDFARLAAALAGEEPDRVPLFEADIALPVQEWFLGREITETRDEVEFFIRAGYDYVPVLAPFFAPRLMRTASREGGKAGDCEGGRTWLVESEGLIRSLEDAEAFPWPRADEVDFSSFEEVAGILPPGMSIIGMLSPAAVFGNVSQSMGLQNFSFALYDDLPLVERLFEIVGSTYVEITRRMVEAPGLGAVLMSDDLAHTGGCLVSPEVYRRYVFPFYRRIGDILEKAGLPFIFHSDGDITEVLDDLSDCGIKAIHPIEPQAMDIVEVKKRFGDRFCIFGNIDLEYTLTRGSVPEVVEQVKERIRALAPGGGYGLSASNSIPDYVKPENFQAMVETAFRYGKYPIDI